MVTEESLVKLGRQVTNVSFLFGGVPLLLQMVVGREEVRFWIPTRVLYLLMFTGCVSDWLGNASTRP